jgi:hypothetical protein
VFGPGSSTSDSINARLSDHEFVVNAKSTAEWLPELVAINKGMHKASATAGHMAALPARPALAPALASALRGSPASGGASRLDVVLHVQGPRTGLMAEIVKGIQADVRINGGGDVQTRLGAN